MEPSATKTSIMIKEASSGADEVRNIRGLLWRSWCYQTSPGVTPLLH